MNSRNKYLTLLYTGFKKLQFTRGGHYDLEIDSRDYIWGPIDLWPKNYVKLGLEMEKKNVNIKNENKNHFVFEQGWLKYKEVLMGGAKILFIWET